MNMTIFFFTETVPKHARCLEETPTSMVLLYGTVKVNAEELTGLGGKAGAH